MGYKYNDSMIRCPHFRRVIKTRKGQFIGIECDPLPNVGMDIGQVIRVRTSVDLDDYTGVFCTDQYEKCPYFHH